MRVQSPEGTWAPPTLGRFPAVSSGPRRGGVPFSVLSWTPTFLPGCWFCRPAGRVGGFCSDRACPLLPPGQLEAPGGLRRGNLGLGFSLSGTCRCDFLFCCISTRSDTAPPALNGSGFENFLQNYTTASCASDPQSPSVQGRGQLWLCPVGVPTWASAPGLSRGPFTEGWEGRGASTCTGHSLPAGWPGRGGRGTRPEVHGAAPTLLLCYAQGAGAIKL